MTAEPQMKAGLEGVIVAPTRLSLVDGIKGELIIAGFPLEELAERASFEETLALLWEDQLPGKARRDEILQALTPCRALPETTRELLPRIAATGAATMDALLMATGTLGLELPRPADAQGFAPEAVALVARIPTAIAAYWRLLAGKQPLAPRSDLGHAANFLYMVRGESPSQEHIRGLETYLNTVVDHGFNASTFTARVITSTGSDLVSAVVGAIGALKGPLHGGAPGPALDMVFEIRELQRAEPYLREKLGRGERLMGFGHRVYKVRDPRAEVLSRAAARLFEAGGDQDLYRLARQVEEIAVQLLAEFKPGRDLQTNVEYYTALLLHGLDLPTELFTPVFAMSRVVGWIAHCKEQQALARLIRPRAQYTGERDRRWVPIEER